MDERQTNELIRNFLSETDKSLELEADLNEFATQIASKLVLRVNNSEAVLANFDADNFAFIFFSSKGKYGVIKLLDLEEYVRCAKLGIPDKAKGLRADFEIDAQHKLYDQVKNVTALLLFKKYGLQIDPVEEEIE